MSMKQAIIIALTVAITNLLLAWLRRPRSVKQKNLVVLPKFVLYLGITVGAGSGGLTAVLWLTGEGWGMVALSSVFVLLAIVLMIAYFNYRILYNVDGFTYRNWLGFSRRYAYKEITGINENNRDVKLYVGRRMVVVESIASGRREFLAAVKVAYRKASDGVAIPKQKREKMDIFHGNVQDSGGIVVMYCILTLILASLTIYLAIRAVQQPQGLDIVLVFGGMLIVWIIYCLVSIHVGRNPDVYGDKIFPQIAIANCNSYPKCNKL